MINKDKFNSLKKKNNIIIYTYRFNFNNKIDKKCNII